MKVVTSLFDRTLGTRRAVDPADVFLRANRNGQSIPVALQDGRYVLYLPFFSHEQPCGFDVRLSVHSALSTAVEPLEQTFRLNRVRGGDASDGQGCPSRPDDGSTIVDMFKNDTSGVDFVEFSADIIYERQARHVAFDVPTDPSGAEAFTFTFN